MEERRVEETHDLKGRQNSWPRWTTTTLDSPPFSNTCYKPFYDLKNLKDREITLLCFPLFRWKLSFLTKSAQNHDFCFSSYKFFCLMPEGALHYFDEISFRELTCYYSLHSSRHLSHKKFNFRAKITEDKWPSAITECLKITQKVSFLGHCNDLVHNENLTASLCPLL